MPSWVRAAWEGFFVFLHRLTIVSVGTALLLHTPQRRQVMRTVKCVLVGIVSVMVALVAVAPTTPGECIAKAREVVSTTLNWQVQAFTFCIVESHSH